MKNKENPRIRLLQELAFKAVYYNIKDGDTGQANRLLKELPTYTKKGGSSKALIAYFEKWGKLYYESSSNSFKFDRNKSVGWTSEYEQKVRASSVLDYLEAQSKPTVFDVDKEFRKVLDRLKKLSADPANTIFHQKLLAKIQEAIYAYGRSDDHENEEKRSKTLFDKSTKRSTLNASKYAKGS